MLVRWGVKQSFVEYVEGLPDGEIHLVDVERIAREFIFRAQGTAESLALTGSIRFTGHGGSLDVELAHLQIVQRMDDWRLSLGAVDVCRLTDGPPEGRIGEQGYTFSTVALTLDGSGLFGGNYNPWTRMDPLTIVRHS